MPFIKRPLYSIRQIIILLIKMRWGGGEFQIKKNFMLVYCPSKAPFGMFSSCKTEIILITQRIIFVN